MKRMGGIDVIEKKLLKGIQHGDIKSYELIIDQYSAYIAKVVKTVGGESLMSQDIEEICADIFIKLWTDSHKIKITCSLKSYLAKMARNRTIDVLRKKNRECSIPLEEDELNGVVLESTIENTLLRKEQYKLLEAMIYKLKEPDREIFIRRYFYMEQIKSIANRLGLNPSTVMTKLSRTKKKLEVEFEKGGNR